MPDSSSPAATIFPSLSYDDASTAIEWLCRAFGFTRRLVVPGPKDSIAHAELSLGTGVIMVSSAKPEQGRVSPRTHNAVTVAMTVFVEDPDAHFATAKAAGAEIVQDLKNEEYGARGYMAKDPEGHLWYFGNYRPGTYWQ